jgi:thiol-disulfide isomerase/thioredoxin
VFDFWATWCGPCRAQHPLYEEVMQKFRGSPDVVFLFINTDEERSAVEPFLKESHWDPHQIYYEDGLTRALSIGNIPTTIVMDRHGEIVSRMNGFVPNRFVDMLSDRIRDALKN